MSKTASQHNIRLLPETLPVFPLPGVLLLPRGQLPLHIFEPRYRAMTEDALRTERMIGMIQPQNEEDQALFETGCAGKITSFTELEDGRFLITLTGISRFKIAEELPMQNGYRQVRPDWSGFNNDLKPIDCLDLDRVRLFSLLRHYFTMQELSCDWDAIEDSTDEKLITALSMICPFEAQEKQALLETSCCRERAKLFMTLLEMAAKGHDDCGCQ